MTSTYTYNADGIRTKKMVGSTTTEYVLNGTQILAEKRGSTIIRYFYDPNGAPVGMMIGSTYYLYEKNLQGDIVGIYNTSGTKIVTYAYDAWGNIINSSYTSGNQTVHDLNPFRYRGYYYDTETGFYYLQSRYYDPAIGRFINADGYINANGDLQGFNMYAYCSNNPVMFRDDSGNSAIAIALFIGGSALFGGIMGAFTSAATNGNILEGMLEGFALGAFAAATTVFVPMLFSTMGVGLQLGATISFAGIGGFGIDIFTQYMSYELSEKNVSFSIDYTRAIKMAFTTGVASAIPTFGNPSLSSVNAIGSLIIGTDASMVNSVLEIIITNLFSH